MTRDSADWNALARYLAGESSPEEAAAIRRWLEEHPSDAEALRALSAATAQLAPARQVDVESALRRVKAGRSVTARPNLWRFAGLAAAAAVVIVVGIYTLDRGRSPADTTRVFETAAGARDTLRLDGVGTVVLGPGSRLEVAGREANLSGEAFFDVVHDSRRPFTVRTGDVVIRDVGTRFAVHGLPDQPVRVVVTEGSVQVARPADSVTIGRGDVAVAESDRIVASRGAATEDDTAWMQGRLVFRDAPLSRVAADLRRWYGLELRVADTALLSRHFTGSFEHEPGDRVVDVIALALGAGVQRRGDTAVISSRTPPR